MCRGAVSRPWPSGGVPCLPCLSRLVPSPFSVRALSWPRPAPVSVWVAVRLPRLGGVCWSALRWRPGAVAGGCALLRAPSRALWSWSVSRPPARPPCSRPRGVGGAACRWPCAASPRPPVRSGACRFRSQCRRRCGLRRLCPPRLLPVGSARASWSVPWAAPGSPFSRGCPVCQLSLFPSLSPSVPPVWAFGGSRSLSPSASALASSVALAVLRSGAGVAVGCCVGADSVVLSAAVSAGLASRLSVFSAFGPLGSGAPAGACSLSAVAAVRAAVAAGASLRSWAGGGPSVPLSVRLAARTRAVGSAASAGAVVFLSASSRGSLSLARSVAARGLPVVAFPASPGVSLPPLSPCGRWLPLAAAPASLSLFYSFPGFFWE